MTGALLSEHGNAADVDALASGVEADGRGLPAKAWMALRRLGRMLLLAACGGQQATIERSEGGHRGLLRIRPPTRPAPRTYADWTWVARPITLPPTVPANAVLHLPALRTEAGRIRGDLAHTHPVTPYPRPVAPGTRSHSGWTGA
ncbi:hypothetical protein [Streptomyces sp. NPDC014656]|uniref:hypothetical protein n=1 Tax=Streptomyces sp. NPDC014656 TaxID=3364878 RepID=UPI0036FFF404